MTSRAGQFEELVSKHARVMSRAIRRVCGRRHHALVPDVEQEVRLALWKRLQGGGRIDYPVSYLYKVALTTALAFVRRQTPEEPMDRPEHLENPLPDGSAGRGLLPAEQRRLIDEVIGALPVDQARAIRAYLVGLNHREVAQLYGWTESTARHRIYRGMDALRTRTDELQVRGGPRAG